MMDYSGGYNGDAPLVLKKVCVVRQMQNEQLKNFSDELPRVYHVF